MNYQSSFDLLRSIRSIAILTGRDQRLRTVHLSIAFEKNTGKASGTRECSSRGGIIGLAPACRESQSTLNLKVVNHTEVQGHKDKQVTHSRCQLVPPNRESDSERSPVSASPSKRLLRQSTRRPPDSTSRLFWPSCRCGCDCCQR